MHIHSCYSDGLLSVNEILRLAAERGVKQISITDHDTLAAYKELFGNSLYELDIIPGCEFSAIWHSRNVHIVGLNLDLKSQALAQAEEIQLRARQKRAEHIARVLEKYGFEGAMAGAMKYANGNSCLGRPHFARFLEAEGHVKDQKQAFKKYLGAGKPGDIKAQWCELKEVVGWILDSGGVPVLAHPLKYGLTRTKLRELVTEFKSAGGVAIEVISGSQDSGKTNQLAKLANEFGFYASVGSDFHQPGQSWADLGRVDALPVVCRPIWDLWN